MENIKDIEAKWEAEKRAKEAELKAEYADYKRAKRIGLINIRISEVEYELIKQKAEEAGLSVSLYMKQKALGKKLPKRVNRRDVKKVQNVLKLVNG